MSNEISLTEVNPIVYILLPAYNEEESIRIRMTNIHNLLARKKIEHLMVIVNDGSTDNMKKVVQELADQMPVRLLNHDTNKGVGVAFRTGFSWLIQRINDNDVIICMEADNTHSIKTINFMLEKLNDGYAVVIASCWVQGGKLTGLSLIRLFLTLAVNRLYRILFPIKGITSYTAFYRAYRGQVIRLASERYGEHLIESDGFASMADLLVKLRQITTSITEVPMSVHFASRKGKSKLRLNSIFQDHLRIIFKNINN